MLYWSTDSYGSTPLLQAALYSVGSRFTSGVPTLAPASTGIEITAPFQPFPPTVHFRVAERVKTTRLASVIHFTAQDNVLFHSTAREHRLGGARRRE